MLEPFLGKSEFANHGQRVVEGQRMMQTASDILLGWDRIEGIDGRERDFYVRQLWDAKGSADVEGMNPKTLAIYAEICGWTLARAHARSGDAIAIGSYLGTGDTFDQAMGSFAEAYADQNERDYAALREAVNGRSRRRRDGHVRDVDRRRPRDGSAAVARTRHRACRTVHPGEGRQSLLVSPTGRARVDARGVRRVSDVGERA